MLFSATVILDQHMDVSADPNTMILHLVLLKMINTLDNMELPMNIMVLDQALVFIEK